MLPVLFHNHPASCCKQQSSHRKSTGPLLSLVAVLPQQCLSQEVIPLFWSDRHDRSLRWPGRMRSWRATTDQPETWSLKYFSWALIIIQVATNYRS